MSAPKVTKRKSVTQLPVSGVLCARDAHGQPLEQTGREAEAASTPAQAPTESPAQPPAKPARPTPVSKDEE